MRVLSLSLVLEWLRFASLLDAQGKLSLKDWSGPVHFKIPVDAGRKTNLGRLLAGGIICDRESLLWIDEFGIWPSSENWIIFNALRSLIGEKRPLQEAPGHLFVPNDVQVIEAILSVVLYFCWGAVLVRGDLNLLIRISHDEYFDVYYKTEAAFDSVNRILKEYFRK